MKQLKKLLALLLVIILAAIIGWALFGKKDVTETKELTSIRLPIDVWPGNFWVIMADHLGYFEEEGLDAKLVDVSGDYNGSVEEFISGSKDELDTHLLAVFDTVEANATGSNLVTVLVSDSSEGAEGLVAKKEFQELKDLKGKRVGVEVGSYLDYFLEIAMSNVDINPDEYIKVDMKTEDLLKEFENAELDAAFSWEPDLTEMRENFDLHNVFDTADIRGLSPGVFVFKRDYLENNSETVQALMNAWYKATEYILNNKEETARIVSQIDFADDPGLYYSEEEIYELYEVDPLLDLEANLKIWGFDTGFESLYGNFQFVSRFIQKSNGFEKMPNTNEMLDDRFLRNIKK